MIVTSAKKTFFAGGNLKMMSQATKADAPRLFEEVEAMKATLRRLETFPRPVVAAINGAALGGGLEIALATNHRIAVDDSRIKIGLPEATLGLLPGGGGVTRTVRMFGLQTALMDVLLQGTQFNPAARQGQGPGRRAGREPGRAAPGGPRLAQERQGRGVRRGAAVGPPRLQDARRQPQVARRWRRSCPPSRRCCASSSRVPTTRRRRRSSRPRSRVRPPTSTPPRGSSRATSPA